MIDADILAVLACPCCRGKLENAPGPGAEDRREGLLCATCALVFPSEGSIQILLKEEGISLPEWQAGKRKNKV